MSPSPHDPRPPANVPSAARNIWMLWLPIATAIRSPDGEYATEYGAISSLTEAPGGTNAKSNSPSAARNTCTRPFHQSATASRVPSGEYAMERGRPNCPGAPSYGIVPTRKSNVPLGWKTWMRWLYVSATAIRSPDGE